MVPHGGRVTGLELGPSNPGAMETTRPRSLTASRFYIMYQVGRITPMWLSATLLSCALVGCDSFGSKKEPVAPPVATTGDEAPTVAQAQMPLGKGGEVELVEASQRARAEYRQALLRLHAYYNKYGYLDKSRWAEKELAELGAVTQYPYLGDQRLASPAYKPVETVSDADTLYAEARKMHEGASGLGGLLGDSKGKLEAALTKYRQLIDRHPQSDKIDDAAFYAGEIYSSDAYKEYTLALNYYQRCLKWNPATEHPAKFRMAFIYDRQMRDRERALALYKEVVASSTNRANVRFAENRIRVLTDRGSYEAPDAEPAPK